MIEDRRTILLAYALTERASIQQALFALGKQGDHEAQRIAVAQQREVARAAVEWVVERGMYLQSGPDALAVVLDDARAYLTQRMVSLDQILGLEEKEGHPT